MINEASVLVKSSLKVLTLKYLQGTVAMDMVYNMNAIDYMQGKV